MHLSVTKQRRVSLSQMIMLHNCCTAVIDVQYLHVLDVGWRAFSGRPDNAKEWGWGRVGESTTMTNSNAVLLKCIIIILFLVY